MSKASPNFNPTSWTIVLEAADSQSPSSTEALAKICETYWHPLYFHIRRNRISQEDAADLIQGFFLKVIQNGFLKAADQSKGKFRTFLLTALQRYMINEWRAGQAQKRGGAETHLSLDFEEAENLFTMEDTMETSSDQDFDRAWALEILNISLQQVEKDFSKRGKHDLFQAVKGYLPGTPEDRSQEETADVLGMPINTLRSHIRRTRSDYKQALRQTVENTVDSPEKVDEEIRYLITILGS